MDNKSFITLILSFILTLIPAPGKSRDVNLDRIYIKYESPYYNRLLDYKLENYNITNSLFIDRDVIFAFWTTGKEILYISEFPGTNVIMLYDRILHRRTELARLSGTITTARLSAGTRYLFLKRILINRSGSPSGETILLDLKTGELTTKTSFYYFLDFSFTNRGDTILYETKNGITALEPEFGKRTLLCKKEEYSDIYSSSASSIAYFSPDEKKKLILNGSGGYYRSKILNGDDNFRVWGITSATEVAWLDSRKFICRRGYPGNFSVQIYDIKTRKFKVILRSSLNTNINYSPVPGLVSFLDNQLIHVYRPEDNSIYNTGIEGEDVLFSPDGRYFVSLLYRKLFVTSLSYLKNNSFDLNRNARRILSFYESIEANPDFHKNEYSAGYLKSKISSYRKKIGISGE